MKMKYLSYALLVSGTAFLTSCEDHRLSPNAPFPERISFVAPRQYPEGITYSSQIAKFLVSSIVRGTIGAVDTDGRYADLITSPELVSSMGMRVGNGRLFVCVSDQGVSPRSTPQTTRQIARLLVFNIATGQLERRTDLDGLVPVAQQNLANDLALNPNGTVYVTDSFSPVIYKVAPDGTASILAQDNVRFSSPGFGLNGIVYHPNNFLIVANTGQGKLYKVDLQNGNAVTEITITNASTLPGDGLTLLNNDLYVVTGGNRVAQVRSTDNWQTASVVKYDADGYAQATTNVTVNNQVYTLNARIGEISAAMGDTTKLQSRDYSIQRFR